MNDAKTWAAIWLLMLIFSMPLFAQEETEEPYSGNTVVLPFLSYTPETRWMFGGLLAYQFKPRGAGPETRASQVLFSGIYTLNSQLIIEFIPSVILPEERWMLDGYYNYSFFPDNYWGIGPRTTSEEEIDVEYRRLDFRQSALRQIATDLYAGPVLRWNRLSRVTFLNGDGDPLEAKIIPGSEGSTLPGFGFSVRWDKRNSITFPTEKHFLELSAIFYPDLLGASHPHHSWQLDARKYFDLRDNETSILAVHARLRMTAGDPPFQEFSLLGGREIMRGYYMGRFRDKNAVQLQAELRQHLFGRFGIAVFVAAGEVWDQFSDFTLGNPKIAGGAGIRFNMNPDDTSNIRIDYGIGRHDSGLYITVGEAF